MTNVRENNSRPDIFVIARILEILWSRESEVKKTELQMASRLNYDIFTKYISWLETRGLIVTVNKDEWHKIIKLTSKGEDAYKGIINWIREFVENI